MNTVILSLGSNIKPEENMPEAVRRLSRHFNILAVSSLWETAAVGTDGPAFLNAAIKIETNISIDSIKIDVLRKIESEMGRVRGVDKYAPRTIDLDILTYEREIIEPNIFKLDYLIFPVAELDPNLPDPTSGKLLSEIAKKHCCSANAVRISQFIY